MPSRLWVRHLCTPPFVDCPLVRSFDGLVAICDFSSRTTSRVVNRCIPKCVKGMLFCSALVAKVWKTIAPFRNPHSLNTVQKSQQWKPKTRSSTIFEHGPVWWLIPLPEAGHFVSKVSISGDDKCPTAYRNANVRRQIILRTHGCVVLKRHEH